MKKTLAIVTSLLIIFAGIGGIIMFSTFNTPETEKESNTLYWLPEESFFVGYEITEQKTVKVKYSICFVNNSTNDALISLSAKFNAREVRGWLNQDKFYEGCNEDGELLYAKINHGEKVHVVFVFEGEYLGGTVTENLSFPEEIILTHSFS